ncbi:Gfo/Idh/MocA family protein [Novipirellula artificiosorum]|uniref:Putative oxidoreductase YcjS n=1 Tax=Novipirellula artificiosorum TaxID=2528016 RepID=A0A5C6DQ43_9BACT|nr:Gfo/Idh/MocA family oxidoreductase [Novipirellula artificiosorum]TWU37136.1 putative oxidoreductase YcjS [Novipirellula artificiosorum]
MTKLRAICIGTGYFSRFHYEAWNRIEDVEIVGICNRTVSKAEAFAKEFGIQECGDNLEQMIDRLKPDFVDIITPPETHLPYVKVAAERGIPILCQKALAPTFDEAKEIVETAQKHQVPFMVHENFRFQPWHREIKKLLQQGAIGKLHSLTFRSRMGDGWGEDAYIPRQPFFRTMPRLLVFENGVHFIDTYRYLAGEISGVYSVLRQLNPVIQGEDAGLLLFEFESGAVGLWDANRYNECNDPDPRYTFGEFLVEGDEGSIRLYLDGRITVQRLGQGEQDHEYHHQHINFAGDCVYNTFVHFIDALKNKTPFETDGPEYLKTLAVQEAAYRSADLGMPVRGL